jgi:hypothetical protein
MRINMKTYNDILKKYYPGVNTNAGSDYNNIAWNTLINTIPTKEELDALILEESALEDIHDNLKAIASSASYLDLIKKPAHAFSAIASISGTSLIPYDNTIPTITEGTEIATVTITPLNNTTSFLIDASFNVESVTSARNLTATLWRGTTLIAIASVYAATANQPYQISFNVNDNHSVATASTYTVRFGASSSATWRVNKNNATNGSFGGAYLAKNGISVIELV